ncbi:hypothetical protein EMCRGX_G034779 [Ephydatia muelleri]
MKFKNDDMWNLLLPNAEHIIEEPDGGWQNIEYTVCKKADEPLEEEQGRTLQRLPPLEPFSLSSTQAHSDHDPATIELKHLEMPGEAIVLKLQKYQIYDTWNVDYLHYYNETDIRNYVAEVLRMIIYALKLKDVEVRCEISVFELRPDLWLVQRRHNHNHFTPIGVVEVKRPAVDLMPSPLGNGKVLGQLYDYLVMLKTQFDLNFAIGIVTTYKEWRICWLQEDDSIITTLSHENDAVQAVSSEIVPEISMQDEKDDDDDQSAEKSTSPRCLCGTDIMTIHPDSTEVIVSVASAINKMLQVKTLSSRLIRKNREYFVYSKSGWFWAKSPWNDDHNPVYNIMPHGNSSQFFILKSLGNGIEGRVWLACTKSRRVCALKFRKDNDLEQTEKEAEWWKRLGFQASRVVTLVKNKYAIVMPYLLPCSNLQVQVENFYKLAEDAVCHMSSKKLCHHDIHIANMGYYHSSNGEVKISFLDLSSVSEMTSLARFGGGVLVPGLHASHILARVVVLLVAAGQCNAVGGGDSDAGGGKVSAAAGGGSAAGGGGSAAAQMWFASRKQEIRPTDQSGIPIL